MFKAVENLREQKGFTLIELLIVIAIIGILASIAIPAFLGQREKAKQRTLEASAKGAVTELQGAIDDVVSGNAMVFLTAPGKEWCFQKLDTKPKRSCENLFNDLFKKNQYSNYPKDGTGLSTILDAIVAHHNDGKEEVSPFTGDDLFIKQATAKPGHVNIFNTSASAGVLQAWSTSGALILNAPVSAR